VCEVDGLHGHGFLVLELFRFDDLSPENVANTDDPLPPVAWTSCSCSRSVYAWARSSMLMAECPVASFIFITVRMI